MKQKTKERRQNMKSLFSLLALIAMIGIAQGQSVHQSNVQTVAQTYWTSLGRAPDQDGLAFWTYELDRHIKNRDDLSYAFRVSIEFVNATEHPTECVADYSKRRNFMQVRYAMPEELVTIEGAYKGRNVVGDVNDGIDPLTGVLGNTVTIKSADCTMTLWYDHAKGWPDSQILISMLPNSSKIQITYDPMTGMGYDLKILAFK